MNIATKSQIAAYANFRNGVEAERGRITPASGRVLAARARSAQAILALLSEMMDGVQETMRERRFSADNSDRAFELEATLYAYMKASNPTRSGTFEAYEQIGAADNS